MHGLHTHIRGGPPELRLRLHVHPSVSGIRRLIAVALASFGLFRLFVQHLLSPQQQQLHKQSFEPRSVGAIRQQQPGTSPLPAAAAWTEFDQRHGYRRTIPGHSKRASKGGGAGISKQNTPTNQTNKRITIKNNRQKKSLINHQAAQQSRRMQGELTLASQTWVRPRLKKQNNISSSSQLHHPSRPRAAPHCSSPSDFSLATASRKQHFKSLCALTQSCFDN